MKTQVYLVFDEKMALHRPIHNPDNPDYYAFENPDRVLKVYGKLLDLERHLARSESNVVNSLTIDNGGLVFPRFIELACKPVERETVELVHSREHYDWLYHTSFLSDQALLGTTDPDDLYICQSTFLAASLACGGAVQCVDAVTDKETNITRAIALVRPPGHHAERSEAMGRYNRSSLLFKTMVLLLQWLLNRLRER